MQDSHREQKQALIALFTGAVLIGFSPVLVRLSDVSPLASAFFRVCLALPLIYIIAYRKTDRKKQAFSLRLLIPGMLFAADLALWHLSIHHTYVTNATLLANAAPVFVTLGAWLILRERISRGFLLGLVIAMVGAVILMSESLQMDTRTLLGDTLGIATAVFYGAYLLSIRYLRRWYSTMILLWWSSLVTAICLLPIALVGSEQFIPVSLNGWLVLFVLAWFAHAGGQGLITYALAHLSAGFSSVTLLVQPLVAGILAWFIFDEVLSATQLSGVIITLGGIYLCKRTS